MSLPVVSAATESQRQAAISVITLAFASDPLARWALPDAAAFVAAMPTFVDAFGGPGLAHGATYLVDGGAGAALWLPPDVHPDDERMAAAMASHMDERVLEDMQGVFEQMSHYHPPQPHWYLPLIGVDPACQGRGLGAALMRHAVERCDADGVAAYLESSNPRNISLYERHGFEALGTIQVGGSPEVVPMLREPR
ncbi:MAG: N-acetyltransferase [Pseudomonadales bacterium]